MVEYIYKRYAYILQYLEKHPTDITAYRDLLDLCISYDDVTTVKEKVLPMVNSLLVGGTLGEVEKYELHKVSKKCNLFLAPHFFHNYCVYLEWDREPQKRFYSNRYRSLRPIVDALQKLADDKLDLLCVSMPPGVGKSTLALFFLTWMGGRMPDKQILGASHNTSFLRGCYDQILRILGNDGEYLYNDVFPKSPLVNTNAKDLRIDLETPKRFETFEFTSVGSGNAGKVRATSLLYCDDLVDGIETALSITQLDKLWMQYTADLRQRKQGDACKELHIATRWSVHDVIGRLEDIYGDDPRSEFVVVPALDADGESNFDYPYGLGFSRKMYEEQRDIMDDISWRTIYMNQPIEREALVFESDKLQRYMELPAEEPDAVISVCDTKDGGQDYFSAPVAYLYGDRVFIADVVYDNSLPEVVLPRITQKYLDHKVMKARFESNSAGGRMAVEVQKALKDKGSKCSIVTKYTTKNKLTKILVNADYVKQHFIFADDSIASKEYREFMSALCSFSHTGKNKHDDAPDSLAMLVDFLTEMTMNTVQIVKRPF